MLGFLCGPRGLECAGRLGSPEVCGDGVGAIPATMTNQPQLLDPIREVLESSHSLHEETELQENGRVE